jgi:hypothetical protein
LRKRKKSYPLKEQTEEEEMLVLNLLKKMKITGSELSQKKRFGGIFEIIVNYNFKKQKA